MLVFGACVILISQSPVSSSASSRKSNISLTPSCLFPRRRVFFFFGLGLVPDHRLRKPVDTPLSLFYVKHELERVVEQRSQDPNKSRKESFIGRKGRKTSAIVSSRICINTVHLPHSPMYVGVSKLFFASGRTTGSNPALCHSHRNLIPPSFFLVDEVLKSEIKRGGLSVDVSEFGEAHVVL